MRIKTVTVLGANGTMGKNVAAIFASFGGAKVYMMCRTSEQAERAVDEASVLVKADTIKERLIPVVYDDMEKVVPKSELVFESVAEDINIKRHINRRVEKYLDKAAVFCTGTSGLSINGLSEELSDSVKERYMGVHFYNPPYNMPLCEVIPNKKTLTEIKKDMEDYLRSVLFRTVVEVKDEAAFLGNRIGFFFINEAFQHAEKYKEKGGIDFIDAVLGPFTGRNMPPILTADFVGLDVHKAIVDNVYNNSVDCSKESFILPSFVGKLVKEGCLGRKTKCGVYKTVYNSEGKKSNLVYDIRDNKYRDMYMYDIPFKKEVIQLLSEGAYVKALQIISESGEEEAGIVRSFMSRYVIYSLNAAKELSTDMHAADHVMAMGFNWIPPLAVIEAFGGKEKMLQIIKNADMNYINLEGRYVEQLIKEADSSKYNFRKFLKAK